jgi:hypothetical protein
MSEDRRAFLRTMGGLSAALTGGAALGGRTARAEEVSDVHEDEGGRPEPGAAAPRPFVAGGFGLELEGVSAGVVKSAAGGNAFADVVVEMVGPGGGYPRKHIGAPKYEDVSLLAGTGMSGAFYSWIQAAFDLDYRRKNGAVLELDVQHKVRSRREFYNALITEVAFPPLDGASKDPAYMTVKFAPEYTRYTKASGPGPSTGKIQKSGCPRTSGSRSPASTRKPSTRSRRSS